MKLGTAVSMLGIMFIALGASVVLALTTGLYLGIQARVTAEELAEQERAAAEASEFDENTKKVMDELWRMEKVEAVRASRPKRLPTVMTKEEVRLVLDRLTGTHRLMASLPRETGEVRKVDFQNGQLLLL